METKERASVDSTQPRWTDVALAAALAAAVVVDGVVEDLPGPDWLTITALVLAAGTLVWRRRFPLLPLVTAWSVIVILAFAFGAAQTLGGVFVVVVAVYSAVAYGARVWVVIAVSLAGAVLRDLNDPQVASVGDFLFTSPLVLLTVGAGYAGRQIKEGKRAMALLAVSIESERQALAEAAAAEERLRIAREVHDVVAHSVGSMVVQAGAAEQLVDRDPVAARAGLRGIRETGAAAIAELRTILTDLRVEGSPPPMPSMRDIDALVARTQRGDLAVSVQTAGPWQDLPAVVGAAGYRVVQESLANALKHARCTRAEVHVTRHEDDVHILVVDDGDGGGGGGGSGLGLQGLSERVAALGGSFSAGKRPGGGWAVEARIPVPR